MRGDRPPFPRSGIYMVILWMMVANVVLGAALAFAGGTVWANEAVRAFGTWLALVSGAAYLFFRWLGIRESRRRRDEDR